MLNVKIQTGMDENKAVCLKMKLCLIKKPFSRFQNAGGREPHRILPDFNRIAALAEEDDGVV